VVKDNGPVAVLNSGRSCHTPCARVIVPPLFFMSVYAKVLGFRNSGEPESYVL
jgi:hypothetical protein